MHSIGLTFAAMYIPDISPAPQACRPPLGTDPSPSPSPGPNPSPSPIPSPSPSPNHYQACVLQLGTNNIESDSVEEILRGVSSLVRLLRGRWAGTTLVLVGLFPRGVAASNPLREKVRRVNLGLSSLVAHESSERLLFLDAAALMPLQPDGGLDRAWTFDYVHLTSEMYARYGDALLAVLRPSVQPR